MTYRKKFKVREDFPVTKGDFWMVRERNKIAETWHVLQAGKTYFIAEVTEHFPVGG